MTQETTTSRFRPSPSTARRRSRWAGFTLVELLAVMLILAILMTLAGGTLWRIFRDVRVEETKNNMQIIMAAITEYRRVKPEYPIASAWVSQLAATAESRALIGDLGENVWSAANNDEFRDAWGNAIAYSPSGGPAGAPGLTSGGPDGEIDTKEDNVRYNK